MLIDKLMRDGRSLFYIYEELRAKHPDLLRQHHDDIEKQYFELKQTAKSKKKRIEEIEDSDDDLPKPEVDDL